MTKLLDRAVQITRGLPTSQQDDIARVVLQLACDENESLLALSQEERDAVATSKAAAARGDFASEVQVRSAWAKHNL